MIILYKDKYGIRIEDLPDMAILGEVLKPKRWFDWKYQEDAP